MDCRRYRGALSDVAAGAAPPAGFELHLAACGQCRRDLAALRNVLAAASLELERLVAMKPSARFAQRIRVAAVRDAAAPVRPTPWLWPACAAASAVFIAVMTFVAGQSPRMTAELAGTPVPAPAARTAAGSPAVDPGSVGAGEIARVSPVPRPEGRRARPAAVEPRILIPEGEAEALMAFAATIPPGEPVSDAPAAEPDSAAPLAALAPITIRPIEIVPLDPPAHFGT